MYLSQLSHLAQKRLLLVLLKPPLFDELVVESKPPHILFALIKYMGRAINSKKNILQISFILLRKTERAIQAKPQHQQLHLLRDQE